MTKLHYGSETSYCPECKERAEKQDWPPPEGLDPHLVKFICSRCKLEFYVPEAAQTPAAADKFI